MNAAQNKFISSTFWTERAGPSAALKTLELIKKIKSWEIIKQKGKKFKRRINSLRLKYDLPLEVFGNDGIPSFAFKSKKNLKYKTFITQEMLKSNILASNVIYISTEHQNKHFDLYFNNLEKIFSKISECENGLKIEKLLEGPVCHATFQRLN